MKTFLIENNKMELAVKRTLKVMRYTKHQSIGMSPFEKHFGRPHNSEISKLLCLENPGKFIMEHVDGIEVWDNTWREAEIEQFEKDRSFGRSRPIEELQEFVKKRKAVSPKYYVHKNVKKTGLESDYLTKPFKADSETKHTVTVGSKTYHKKQLAEVTNVVGLHPEILQEEKKAAGQTTSKTEREALRSTSNGQLYSPEKKLPDDVIPHGVAVGPPGTKGSNSHLSQSWKEAKQAAKDKAVKKKGEETTGAAKSHSKTGELISAQTTNAAPTTASANMTSSPTNSNGQVQSNNLPNPGDSTAANQGNSLTEDLVEDQVRRSSRLRTASRTQKFGAIVYD